MKAVQIDNYGSNEVIKLNNNAEKPSLKPGQILVEVYAASLNPVDKAIREGYMQKMLPLSFPITLGGDFSGVVMEVAPGEDNFKIGDGVYGQAIVANGGSGSLAEFTAANSSNTALKPKSIDFDQAASLPLVGASALQAIEEHINLKEGQKILIHGGAGGIGSIAVQLAKMHGAFVAATASRDQEEFVKGLGADQVIDYRGESFEEILTGFDAVFDTVGGEVTSKSFKVLRRGGTLVSMRGQANQELAKQHGVTAMTQGTQTNSEHLTRLAGLVDGGKIKPQVDKVFPLEQSKEAFDYLEKRHPKGKVVIEVKKT
jgi:alcohol dehydrogenase